MERLGIVIWNSATLMLTWAFFNVWGFEVYVWECSDLYKVLGLNYGSKSKSRGFWISIDLDQRVRILDILSDAV